MTSGGGGFATDNGEGSISNNSDNNSNSSYIQHQVSKMDTLAGIAIKYGVEVADVKRLNGLVTDNQMFALKTLLIPLPGRHPPSPVVSVSPSPSPSSSRENGILKTPPRPRHTNILESFESLRLNSHQEKISPAMSSLQKYYGLKSSDRNVATEETEMAVFRTGSLDNLNEHPLPKPSPYSTPPCRNKKSSNVISSFFPENGAMIEAGNGETDKSSENSVRRRQKADFDSKAGLTEWLLKEENGGGSSDFSPATGTGLAMRQKSAYRTPPFPDSESGKLNSLSVGLGDSVISNGPSGFHKSSSASSLQEDTGNSSVWPTSKWNLKPDLQALSTAAINIPIFDGLPKPISGRRSKAALD